MRRGEREIRDEQAIEQILQKAVYCNLAICDAGQAYVVPLSFGYESGWLYFHCATGGRKLDILRANPRVSFSAVAECQIATAATACGWGLRYRSVIGTGTAQVMEDEASRRRGLDCIMAHYGFAGQPQYDAKALAKTVVVGIKIETLTGKANP
jgi:nitroimidazol reductase NimA-like FMN-containing flavoprotein (pyridoxamine 5'-phosphate oxidase superfamily)